MSPKARTTVRPFSVRPDASLQEQAHARGLKEGMLRKVNRIRQEIAKREALARRLSKKIGMRNKRIAELENLLASALPNLAGYAIMAADQPGSLWSRIHAALVPSKGARRTMTNSDPMRQYRPTTPNDAKTQQARFKERLRDWGERLKTGKSSPTAAAMSFAFFAEEDHINFGIALAEFLAESKETPSS